MTMKQKIAIFTLFFGVACGLSFVIPSGSVSAQASEECEPGPHFDACLKEKEGENENKEEGCTGDDCCGGENGVRTSIIKGDLCGSEDGTAEGSTIFNLLKGLLRIMTAGVGIAAVGGIAWGALLYTTAESKPEQTKKAIGIITNVVIGLIAYAFMFVFLNFLIPGGVFS